MAIPAPRLVGGVQVTEEAGEDGDRPAVLGAVAAALGVLFAYGLAKLKATPTVLGMLMVQGGKLWYLDHMVLLFEEMKTRDIEYARWEY